jgi:hypothetical protein
VPISFSRAVSNIYLWRCGCGGNEADQFVFPLALFSGRRLLVDLLLWVEIQGSNA